MLLIALKLACICVTVSLGQRVLRMLLIALKPQREVFDTGDQRVLRMLLIALKPTKPVDTFFHGLARIAHAINSVETFKRACHEFGATMRVLRMLLIALKQSSKLTPTIC